MNDAYLQLLIEILIAIGENTDNPEAVYPLLEENSDKLDKTFILTLQQSVTKLLQDANADKSNLIASNLYSFNLIISGFPLGNRALNIEIAITCLKLALTVWTRESYAQDWAMIQNSLGAKYSDRIQGEKAENLETAIACYKEALSVLTPKAFPKNWAMTQNNLGAAYWSRIQGETAQNLETAIACYTEALSVLTRNAFPQNWATTQMNLGNVYKNRIQGETAQNLEMAITCYTEALSVLTRNAFPQEWAKTQMNLGTAYWSRIQGETARNLEKAIACYTEALSVLTRNAFPQEWATTQMNLGIAYWDRIQGEKAQNLETAITYFTEALSVYTRNAFPQDWAKTQMNLGNAYSDRIQGEKAQNLETAIAYFTKALSVYTRNAFPQDWAKTQMNLGVTYWSRIQGKIAENLANAIACYTKALSVYTRNAFPQDWAKTQMNLGIAYWSPIQGETAENLEKAIACFNEALSVYTRNAFPQDWAKTQMNLGIAYGDRIQGEKAQNLETAIACFNEALSVFTRNDFPQDWAGTQNNLGTVYKNRIQGETAQNLETAIACYTEALSVRTPKAFPQDHVATAFNLGLVYQDTQQWQLAYETFADAINTVETLRSQIFSGEEAKQKLAEEWNKLYRGMVEVCIELKHYEKAIEYVERSKAQNLVEVLAIRDLYPKGKIPDVVRSELERLRQEIDYEDRRQAAASQPDYRLINELRQRYDQLYPFKPIQYGEIQDLIDDHTAILQWYIFGDCFRAFIITRNRSQPLIYTFTTTDLEQLQNWRDEYLNAYYASEQAETELEQEALKKQWQNSLPSRLQDLAKILQIDQILGKFSELPKSINQLILIPHRYLHLFPLHTLPVSTETWLKFHPQGNPIPSHPTVLDCFSQGVRYAPSNQLLKQVQEQKCTEFDRLFAVQTPNPNLKDSDIGLVNAIKQQFLQSDILKNDRAKKSDILHIDAITKNVSINEKLRNSHCAFFLCHGKFYPNNPLDSGLELAYKVVLTLADIIAHFELKNCRLVTLSACETGLTDFSKNSDEYIGLPSGFILAGATNIVSSLWSVNAIATAILMLKFYQELENRENLGNIGLALKTAQCWLRDTTVQGFQTWLPTTPLRDAEKAQLKRHFQEQEIEKSATFQPFESPCYWAAFCAIGKGV